MLMVAVRTGLDSKRRKMAWGAFTLTHQGTNIVFFIRQITGPTWTHTSVMPMEHIFALHRHDV
jgi:hypothetical protein